MTESPILALVELGPGHETTKVGGGGVFTIKLKVVVLVTQPVPVTVIGYVPAGVEREVEIFKVLLQFGVQGLLVIETTDAPDGNPDTDKVTG